MAISSRPSINRRGSRVPGGFDSTDDDLSPIKTRFDDDDADDADFFEESSHSLTAPSVLPTINDHSVLSAPSEDGKSAMAGDESALEESKMRKQLMDLDSSFLPETSPAGRSDKPEEDDASISGPAKPEQRVDTIREVPSDQEQKGMNQEQKEIKEARPEFTHESSSESPTTPPHMYQTPAPGRDELPEADNDDEEDHFTPLSLETMSSSPTAAAAARTVSRALSTASFQNRNTARDVDYAQPDNGEVSLSDTNHNPTSLKPTLSTPSSQQGSPTPTKPTVPAETGNAADNDAEVWDFSSPRSRKRPKFLKSRISSQRSSYSSYTTTSTDGKSDATLTIDYALQSGGAAPFSSSTDSRPADLSRTTSLGSMASGISSLSDEDRTRSSIGILEGNLDILDEEDPSPRPGTQTPKGTGSSLKTPTDTVIAQHVRDVHVPATVAREFRDRHRPVSPEKRNGAPTPSISRHGKNLTLKEQSNTIDRLMKENWDLKLKVSFLDDALSRRSEEGVKEILSENVDLRTAKVEAGKEIRELKRSIRELERRLKEKSEQLVESAKLLNAEKDRVAPVSDDSVDIDAEMVFLRERVMTYEVEIERMHYESNVRENEKRRLAEALRSTSARRGVGSDVGAREEMVRLVETSRLQLVNIYTGHVARLA